MRKGTIQKLTLGRETLRRLNPHEAERAVGGLSQFQTCVGSCANTCNTCVLACSGGC
jgi:hypothetical protein